MIPPPALSTLTEAEKHTLILALWAQAQTLTARVAELEARLNQPPKTPGNSSLPPCMGHKANRPEKAKRAGPRQGSLGRAGGGRPLAEEPDQLVIAKACQGRTNAPQKCRPNIPQGPRRSVAGGRLPWHRHEPRRGVAGQGLRRPAAALQGAPRGNGAGSVNPPRGRWWRPCAGVRDVAPVPA